VIPPSLNLELYRGDTQRWEFTLFTDAGNTVPADLTGVEAAATIRDKATDGAFYLELSCVVELPNLVRMTLPAEDARNLPAKGVWDLQLTYASGDIVSVLKGVVVVVQDVTYPVTP